MLKLFRQQKAAQFDAPIQAERRVYAVGDIHGRFDLLGEIIDKILQDAGDFDGVPQIVFLGDHIDRGESSREVLEFLMAVSDWPEVEAIFLLGNHEQMLLDFLTDASTGARWLRYGGLQTLMSYGTPTYGPVHQPGTLEQIREDLIDAMGPHRGFLDSMGLMHRNGNLLFAHAGANPNLSLQAQDERSLIWGHPRFFDQVRDDGIWVVHGHTVVEEPIIEKGRISVDTGAYFSNRLSAVRLEGDSVKFLTA
ncbi:MAG: metallophosphoesterase family protein [Pseudomonadota bacterium]